MILSQTKLLENIHIYLINRGRTEFAEEMMPGYCHGLSLYFCEEAANNKLDSFYALLTSVAEWKESDDYEMLEKISKIKNTEEWKLIYLKLSNSIIDMPLNKHTTLSDKVHWAIEHGKLTQQQGSLILSTILPDNTSIEKLLNNIEWLQHRYKMLSATMVDTSKINFIQSTDGSNVVFNENVDFVTCMNVPRDKLPGIIANLPVNKPMLLSIGRHGVACYRDKTGWFFYDANNSEQTPKRNTPEELAKDIESVYKHIGEINGTHLPLGIAIYSKQNQDKFDYTKLTDICDQYCGSDNILNQTSNNVSDYPWDRLSTVSLAIIMNSPPTIIKRIIDKNENLTIPDSLGLQPLHYAVLFKMPDIITYLLDKSVNINQRIYREDYKLNNDAQSLYFSLEGATALHLAASNDDLEMVKFLLSKGADINAKTDIGLTPLAFAAMKGHSEMIDFLKSQNADLNIDLQIPEIIRNKITDQPENKLSPMGIFGAINLKYLEDGSNLAMCAASCKQNNIVSYFLENGTDVNASTATGVTLLHIALFSGNINLVKKLLKHHADTNAFCKINPKNNNEITDALGVACMSNKMDMVKLMLENYSPDLKKVPDKIPGIALALKFASLDIIEVLIGSEKIQQDILDYDVSFDSTIKKAYSYKMDVLFSQLLQHPKAKNLNQFFQHLICETDDTSMVEKLISENRVDINSTNTNFSPLLIACEKGRKEMIECLLENGIDIFKYDAYYIDLTDWKRGSILRAAMDQQYQFLHPLIINSFKHENAANLNKLDESGNSAIHHALIMGNQLFLNDLLQLSADPNLKTASGEIPLLIALSNGDSSAIKLLIEAGVNINVSKNGKSAFALLIESSVPNKNELVDLFIKHGANLNDHVFVPNLTITEYANDISDAALKNILQQGKNKMVNPHKFFQGENQAQAENRDATSEQDASKNIEKRK